MKLISIIQGKFIEKGAIEFTNLRILSKLAEITHMMPNVGK